MTSNLEDWIGRREVRAQALEIEALRRYAAAVGAALDVEDTSPPLGHWAWFTEAAAPDGIGPDGHPRRGGFSPPVELPRRMFAQAELAFEAPLELGAPAELRLEIADLRRRSGRTGELVLLDTDRLLVQGGRVRIRERQTIVYREAGEPTAAIVPGDPGAGEAWIPTSVDLFRFSAATFNSHRIHYDLPYAQGEEGYPALVIHGPFTAARLCALAMRLAGGPLATFGFRAMAPLFLGQPVTLRAGEASGSVVAVRCDGVTAMAATFTPAG